MIWTDELEQKLIYLKENGDTYSSIATILGCSLNAATTKGYELIQCGRLKKYVKIHPSRDELLQIIRKYRTRDNTPSKYLSSINREFGSWSAGLKESGLKPNVGGIMDPTLPTTLYLIKIDGYYKIGMTQRTVEQRLSKLTGYTILDTYCSDLDEILSLEREILSKVERIRSENIALQRNGLTECFLFPFDPTFEDLL